MGKFLSIITKIALVGVIVILILVVTLVGLFWYFSRPLSDSQIIKETFEPELPGYSAIRVVERTGERTINNPRVLIIEVVMESYAGPVTCQGEIRYFRGDPSYLGLGWYDWACIGHWILVQDARGALSLDEGPTLCDTRIGNTALVLKRWVENDWVDVNRIRRSEVRDRVIQLLDSDITSTSKPTIPFDVAEARVYDLALELPEEEKVPTYVLRCDGTLDLIWRGGPRWWEQPLDLQVGDIVLPTPIKKSAMQP